MGELKLTSPKEYFTEVLDEGFQKLQIQTQTPVKSYLADMLENFLDSKNFFDYQSDITITELFLQANQKNSLERQELLRKVGDRTLYISGFFGDSFNRKTIDIDYYAQLGGSAYAQVAHSARDEHQFDMYMEISKRFLKFVEVLAFISTQSLLTSNSNILRLYEKYVRTGSDLAKDQLIEIGIFPVSTDQAKKTTNQ
jgi:hypothetical protein